MPKAQPHFDAPALLVAVHQQDIGLRVSTNNPRNFRQIVSNAVRAAPHLRTKIYQCPRSPNAFWLLKNPLPDIEPLAEPADVDEPSETTDA